MKTRTVRDILKEEGKIIENAEKFCNTDKYYLDLFKKDQGAALAYKYGRVTMNLASQVKTLKRQLEKANK